MVKAVEFMREINRKSRAAKSSKSEYLKNDYLKSIRRDIADLKFYCNCHGIKYEDVVRAAAS